MIKAIRQAGAIPYRIVDGKVDVLLVTSRDTGRWVIPKGYVESGKSARQVAMIEAMEEAGVIGVITTSMPMGFIPYFKTLKSGEVRPASIEVYPLLVERQKKKWREKGQRIRMWFSTAEAAMKVGEPALALLLLRLEEIVRAVPAPLSIVATA